MKKNLKVMKFCYESLGPSLHRGSNVLKIIISMYKVDLVKCYNSEVFPGSVQDPL